MKPFLTFILTSFLLTSCCTKKKCQNGLDSGLVAIVGFEENQTDSVLVYSFNADGSFVNSIDSVYMFRTSNYSSTNENHITGLTFSNQMEYRFHFKNLSKTYDLTNIKLRTKKCNTCFLTSDDYMELYEYRINGIVQNDNRIEIIK